MKQTDMTNQKKKQQKGGGIASTLCRIIGILFIVVVILTCIPLTVPRLLGYEIYNVETGSMTPELPVGSVIYVKYVEPQNISPDDIITYETDGAYITHRVMTNRIVEGEFITKGDANETEDGMPVPYSAVVGVVKYHFPFLGKFLIVYSTTLGKIYVLAFAACGVMLNILGSMMRRRQDY